VKAMLLNEFLKQHKKVEEQRVMIAELKGTSKWLAHSHQKEIQLLTEQLRKQAAQIQRVRARLKTSESEPKIIANNP
jgi:bisphosphoglycerate-independent phosphoglycerate mutase (AlkP superfamily)